MKVSFNNQILTSTPLFQNPHRVSFGGNQTAKSDIVEISASSIEKENKILVDKTLLLEKNLSTELSKLKFQDLVFEYSKMMGYTQRYNRKLPMLRKFANEVFEAFDRKVYNNYFIINTEDKETGNAFIEFLDMHAKNSGLENTRLYGFCDFKKVSHTDDIDQFFAQINEAVTTANDQHAKTGKKTLLHIEEFSRYLDVTANTPENIAKVKDILKRIDAVDNIGVIFTSTRNQNLEALFEDIRNHNLKEIRQAFYEPRVQDLLRRANKFPTQSEIDEVAAKANAEIGTKHYVCHDAFPGILPMPNRDKQYIPILLEMRNTRAYPQRFDLNPKILLSDFRQHFAFFEKNKEAFKKIMAVYNTYSENITTLNEQSASLGEKVKVFIEEQNKTIASSDVVKETVNKGFKKLNEKQIAWLSIASAGILGLSVYIYKKSNNKSNPSKN